MKNIDSRWYLHFLTCRPSLRQLATMRKESLLKIKGVGKKYAAVIASWQKELSYSRLKEIRTLNGRLRLWEERPRITELFNTPIQGTAADIVKQAMAMSFPYLNSKDIHLIGTVHDEILLESPQEKGQEISHFLKETMIKAGKKFIQHVPIEVDVVIAKNWSEK